MSRSIESKRAPLSFLLGAPLTDLDSFRLARLAAVADLRKELHAILDKLIDEMTQATLAAWFAENDREALKRALETEEDARAWARRMIRGGHDVLPQIRKYAAFGQAHRIAALTYQKRNIAAGKCSRCPRPLDRNSVVYCTKHLAQVRERARKKSKRGN